MPNIEIHGFSCDAVGSPPGRKICDLKCQIFGLFQEKQYVDDMVVTTVADNVWDKTDESQPFLRVVSTTSDYLDEIVQILKKLNLDIEVIILTAFHPKTK